MGANGSEFCLLTEYGIPSVETSGTATLFLSDTQKCKQLIYAFNDVQLIITHKKFVDVIEEGVKEREVLERSDRFFIIVLQLANPSVSLSLTKFTYGNDNSANMNKTFYGIYNDWAFTKKFYKVVSF